MEQALRITKITLQFMLKYIWVVVLLVVVNYFIYQNSFSWNEADELAATNTLKTNEETIFIVIKETYAGGKSSDFDSLSDSLQTWSFDERNKKLYVKYEKLLPYTKVDDVTYYDQTKVVLLYDRGYDSFERYSEVISIASFPFNYYFNGKPFIKISGIHEDGTVFLEYKDKRIQLQPNEQYATRALTSFQLSKTVIENHGIYQKDQFLPFTKAMNDESKKKNKNKKETILEPPTEQDEPSKVELPNIHQ